jgi:hypothetical protein
MSVERAEVGSRDAGVRLPTTAGLAWTILAFGALAHVAWYLERGSLWLDEAFLALNIAHGSPVELLGKLSFDQGAPWGFLLAEKLTVATLGVGDRPLRLVPLLAALAALPLFWRVASFYLRGSALLLALLLFCFSPFLVEYSAEVKQYSVDVLAALVALWLAHLAREPLDWRRTAAIGIAGAVLPWFSHASMMVLGAGGLAVGVAALARREWPALRRLVIVGLAWGASASAFFLFAWPKLTELHGFLSSEEAYRISFPPTSRAEAELLVRRVSDIVEVPFGLYGRPLSALIAGSAALLALAGAVSLARRDRLGAAVLFAPFIAAGAALASGLYPFGARFVLFLVPLIVILVTAGTAAALQALSREGLERRFVAGAAVTASVFLLSVAGSSTARLLGGQWEMQEVKPVLEHLRSVWQPGDVVYLYASVQYPARYYAEVDGVNRSHTGDTLWRVVPTAVPGVSDAALRSAPPTLVVGRFRPGGSTFARDLAALDGRKRVWFVFSNVVRFESGEIVDDLDRHIAALDAAGQRRATIRRGSTIAVLFDLRG